MAVAGVDREHLAGIVVPEEGPVVECQGALHRATGVSHPARLPVLFVQRDHVSGFVAEEHLSRVDKRRGLAAPRKRMPPEDLASVGLRAKRHGLLGLEIDGEDAPVGVGGR